MLLYFLRRVESREDAADLLGETLLVLWRRSDRVPDDAEQARMWLYGIARRVLATHRRGRGRGLALVDRLRDELAAHAPEPDEVTERVRAAVRSLPEKDRELIGLVHWDGFTLAEAAAIVGVRAGATRMRYQRARDRLRALLEQV